MTDLATYWWKRAKAEESRSRSLLQALETGDKLWAMMPFDSGEDIAIIARQVQKIQDNAIWDATHEGT